MVRIKMLVCLLRPRQSCIFTQIHLKYGDNFTRNRKKTVAEANLRCLQTALKQLRLTLLCPLPSSQLTLQTARERDGDRYGDNVVCISKGCPLV